MNNDRKEERKEQGGVSACLDVVASRLYRVELLLPVGRRECWFT